jgi:hypothetical protein
MMENKFSVILAILVVLTALAVAGCTTTTTSPAATTGAATTGAATTAPAATTTTTGATPSYNLKAFTVLSYKITSTNEGQTTSVIMKYEIQPTQVHYTMMMEGMSSPIVDQTIPIDQVDSSSSGQQGSGLSDLSSADYTTKFVKQGTEVLTVPAGTFTCDKYTVTTDDTLATYWFAGGIAAPVKMTIADKGSVASTMELVEYK